MKEKCVGIFICLKFIKWVFRQWKILFICAAVLAVSCRGDDDKETAKYDSSKPPTLTSFYPGEGKFQEKVILNGDNFPTDPNQVKVYFNQRRAPVIGSTGKRMYVMAPRLPGDECVISVVVGNDSLVYNDIFLYEESITVTTIAGNGNVSDFQDGALTEVIFQPRYVCVDNDNNVFVTARIRPSGASSDINNYLCRLNEAENICTRLQQSELIANIPCVDPITGIVSSPTETTIGSFVTCSPDEYWAPRQREMKWLTAKPHESQGWKHSMVVNPTDGYIYTRWYHGHIVRINQETYEAEVIHATSQGDSYGMTFRPGEPNILYISFWNNGNENANSICKLDLNGYPDPNDPTKTLYTWERLSSPATGGGHRDGDLSVAQFRQPAQIYCDADGFIYVADAGNHCIRRITPENQVETVLGIPGEPGWRDGTREEALFRNPTGIGISKDGSVYVADNGNGRLRKLSVN